ncbi:MAG: PQQ-like beta-propeller repeat protein [Chloroflexi bacterium]|nr:PQQ-like beta-propeller repeat protein [Chloroflexota bacterium]
MIGNIRKLLSPGKLLLWALLLGLLIFVSCAPGAATVPKGWSGAVIADDTLIIGSMEGKMVALNTADGKRLWELPLEMTAQPGGLFGCAPAQLPVAIYGSPTIAGDLIYLGGYDGKFYAFVPGRDDPRWIYPRQGTVGGSIVGGAATSVSQDKVFFGASDGTVYALDAADGFRVWTFPTKSKIWSTPAVLEDTLFVGTFDKKLHALDTATGGKKWTFEAAGAIVATPAVHDGTVFVGSFDRNLYAVDVISGQLKWTFTAGNWFWARPIATDGAVYAASLDGKVHVLDAGNGSTLAEFSLDSPVSSSPVLAGGSFIVASEKGIVYAIDTAGKEIRTLVDLELKGAKINAPLATDGKMVYVHASNARVYAVNVDSGADIWSVSLRSAPAPSQETGGANWGIIIGFIVLSLLTMLLIKALRRRPKA